MNWYVRWEETEKISGPMTKEEALDKTSDGLGMIFCDKIFEPEFVTTEDVENLLAEMKSSASFVPTSRMSEVTDGILTSVQYLLKRAIDTIVLLSGEKLRLKNENDLRHHKLSQIAQALLGTGGTVTEEIEKYLQVTVIECSIEGGVFSVDSEMPIGVKLEVNDYDAEGYDEECLSEDESGETCAKLEFSKR